MGHAASPLYGNLARRGQADGSFRLDKGGRVNQDKPVSFRFNGRQLTGFEGDTIASALLANNVRQVGRSFKYHRMRGVMSAGPEEGGALFNVNEGAKRIANVKGTMAELRQDMQVPKMSLSDNWF